MSTPPAHEVFVVNDAMFNSFIVETLLCGVYALIFATAIWRLSRKEFKPIYTFFLASLWIAVMTTFAADWSEKRGAFVVNNSSALSIDLANLAPKKSSYLISEIAYIVAMLIADGILIWRCTLLWNGHRSVFFGLAIIFLATLGGNLRYIAALFSNATSTKAAFVAQAFAYCASAVCTFCATSLITLRIITVTKTNPFQQSYRKVVDILIQSAAPYTTLTLFFGVMCFFGPLNLDTPSGLGLYVANVYAYAFQAPIMGIAPTLIALRVASEAAQEDRQDANPMSGISFRRPGQSRHGGGIGTHISAIHWGTQPGNASSHSDTDVEAQVGSASTPNDKLDSLTGLEIVEKSS